MSIQEIIITALIASIVLLMGILHFKDNDLKKSETALMNCQASITEQNAAIKEQQNQTQKIQLAVNNAQLTNQILSQSTTAKVVAIQNTKTISSCDKAVAWGASQAKLSAAHWQTTANS